MWIDGQAVSGLRDFPKSTSGSVTGRFSISVFCIGRNNFELRSFNCLHPGHPVLDRVAGPVRYCDEFLN